MSEFSADDYDNAALDELYPTCSSRGWWSEARAAQQAAINAQRKRAEAMTDKKWRKAFLHWVDFFQRDLDEDIQRDKEWAESKESREAEDQEYRTMRDRAKSLLRQRPPEGSETPPAGDTDLPVRADCDTFVVDGVTFYHPSGLNRRP